MGPPGFNQVKGKRAFEQVIGQLRQAILDGRLQPGDPLPDARELADAFKVGRPALREALRVLESFGALEARDSGYVVAASGNFISFLLPLHASLRRIPMADLVETRVAVESWTASEAAARHPSRLGALGDQIASMRVITEPLAFLELDTEFHLTIARLSGNAVAPLLVEALREATAVQLRRALAVPMEWRQERLNVLAEHERLAEAIWTGEPAAASAAMTAHLRSFYDRVRGMQPVADPHLD